MTDHYITKCSCGVVISQCRCPGVKRVIISMAPCTHEPPKLLHCQEETNKGAE